MALVDRSILGGKTSATRAQMVAYLARTNPALAATEAEVIISAYLLFGTLYTIDAALAFAQACHETSCFRFGSQVTAAQHNPAGLGATNDGASGLGWPTWPAGIRAHFVHLLCWCNDARGNGDPRLLAVLSEARTKGYAVTWRDLGGRWAVPGVGYGDGIERHWAAMLLEEAAVYDVAIASGHHNSDGGDAYEAQQTGQLTASVAAWCRKLGMSVIVMTPSANGVEGAGMFAGGIWDVARAVTALTTPPRIFIETHTEGGGGTGVFAIYPDAPPDTDTDVRDRLGSAVAKRIAAATGLALGGPQRNGVMSEKQTGVGGQGFRLGIFNKTEPIKTATTRLIIEYGAHDKQPDLDIAKSAEFYAKCGQATAEAFAAYLGIANDFTPQQPTPKPPLDPGQAEAQSLKQWAEANIPPTLRGALQREGVADLRAFGGKPDERIALYERVVAHRLAGQNYVMILRVWDDLRDRHLVTLF